MKTLALIATTFLTINLLATSCGTSPKDPQNPTNPTVTDDLSNQDMLPDTSSMPMNSNSGDNDMYIETEKAPGDESMKDYVPMSTKEMLETTLKDCEENIKNLQQALENAKALYEQTLAEYNKLIKGH